MAYLTQDEISKIGFKSFGENLKISDKAIFHRPERITIGNNVRIDDFCVLANHIIIHDFVHIALYGCLLSSDNSVIEMEDFSGLAFKGLILTNSDDYSGSFMTNPTIPVKYRNITEKNIKIGRHCVIGAGSIIMASVKEGTSVGSMSLVIKPTLPWKIYFGSPARPLFDREKKILELERQFRDELEFEIHNEKLSDS